LLSIGYCNTISNMTEIIRTKERTFIEFNEGFLNNIIHIGKLNLTGAQPSLPPHQHRDALEICYVHRGNPVFQTKERQYHLKGGDVFLSFPNEIHSSGKYPLDRMILYWMGIQTSNLRGNFLQFSDSLEAEAFLGALRNLKNRKFRGAKRLKTFIEEILELFFSEHDFRNILIRNRVSDFLVSIINLEKKSNGDSLSAVIRDCVNFIEENVSETIKLKQLADKTGLSLSRFKQKFKDETGVPPGEFIIRQKVEKAALELKETEKEITEIAYDLEFSSSQYFATVFRRYKNCSPSSYRRNN
jgi:AraC-like DNA-binding protein